MEARNFTSLTRGVAAAAGIFAGAQMLPKSPDKTEFKTEQAALSVPRLETPEKKVGLSEEDFDMLAQNVYHEARGESVQGRLAVAQVTLARIGSHGDNVTDVVFKKKQFSWTDDPKILMAPIKQDELAGIRNVLRTIIGKRSAPEAVKTLANITGVPENARYYKMTSIKDESEKSKKFFETLRPAITIGSHTFYVDEKRQKARGAKTSPSPALLRPAHPRQAGRNREI